MNQKKKSDPDSHISNTNLPRSANHTTYSAIHVLGGGPAGLSAAYTLSKAGQKVTVFEGESNVGGLSKTIVHKGFRFDLGGHRFLTHNKKIEQLIQEILEGQYRIVPRKSKIYMSGKYFDYPIRPVNALFGLGMVTALKIILDYCKEKLKNKLIPSDIVTLEDWIINRFGRKIFILFFKGYSEKVWGIECGRISKDWVAQRIRGLSFLTMMREAFFKFSGKKIDTLANNFIYPLQGIGQISENLQEKIEAHNSVLTNTRVIKINHNNYNIKNITVTTGDHQYNVEGTEFISTIPLTNFVEMLDPNVPPDIIEAAARLKYRDLIVVVVMLNRENVTNLTWMYLPEKEIPFGRIHEPKNWSAQMAPEGKTHIVAEYFCFKGDEIWNSGDKELGELTAGHLARLGLISEREVIDSYTIRVPKAYPLFEVGYEIYTETIISYMARFKNLHLCGRAGMFKYFNIDHAIDSGINAAENILQKPSDSN